MIVLLDLDGVICNFVDGIIETHGWPITHAEYTSWGHHKTFGLSDAEMWEPTNTGKWWLNLNPYPWASELVIELREISDVIFCTSPNLDASCPSQKVQWLRDHGLMRPRRNDYQIGRRKELNAMSGAILVDDSESNVFKYTDAGGVACLFPQPWNHLREWEGDRVKYVFDFVKEKNQ